MSNIYNLSSRFAPFSLSFVFARESLRSVFALFFVQYLLSRFAPSFVELVFLFKSLQLQLQLELLLGATRNILSVKKNGDLCQNMGTYWMGGSRPGRGWGLFKGRSFRGQDHGVVRGVEQEQEQGQQTRRRCPTPGQPCTQGLVYVVPGPPFILTQKNYNFCFDARFGKK